MCLNRRNGEGCDRVCLRVVRVEVFLGAGIANSKVPGPLAVDGVEDLSGVGVFDEGGGEAVLLTGEPAFAAVVDFGEIAGRGLDEGGFIELDLVGD